MKRHKMCSPATLIASVALFFSLAGTGIAASHYLITSVHQIKPAWSRSYAVTGKPSKTWRRAPSG